MLVNLLTAYWCIINQIDFYAPPPPDVIVNVIVICQDYKYFSRLWSFPFFSEGQTDTQTGGRRNGKIKCRVHNNCIAFYIYMYNNILLSTLQVMTGIVLCFTHTVFKTCNSHDLHWLAYLMTPVWNVQVIFKPEPELAHLIRLADLIRHRASTWIFESYV